MSFVSKLLIRSAIALSLSVSAMAVQAQVLPSEPGSPSYTLDFTSGSWGNGRVVFWRQKLSDGKTYLLGRMSPRQSTARGDEVFHCNSDNSHVFNGTAAALYWYSDLPRNAGPDSCFTLAGGRTFIFNPPTAITGWTIDKSFTVRINDKQTIVIPAADAPNGSGATAYNYSDSWYVPTESGWGVQITHHVETGGMLFATFYLYDEAGKPKWYMVSGGNWTGNTFSGSVYEVAGPAGGLAGLANFDPKQVKASSVGTAAFLFTSQKTATLNYTISGVSGTKNIERLAF